MYLYLLFLAPFGHFTHTHTDAILPNVQVHVSDVSIASCKSCGNAS